MTHCDELLVAFKQLARDYHLVRHSNSRTRSTWRQVESCEATVCQWSVEVVNRVSGVGTEAAQ